LLVLSSTENWSATVWISPSDAWLAGTVAVEYMVSRVLPWSCRLRSETVPGRKATRLSILVTTTWRMSGSRAPFG
jgi:hypothetical protein